MKILLVLLVHPIASVRGEGEHVVDGIIRDSTLTPSALTNPLSHRERVSELKGGIGKIPLLVAIAQRSRFARHRAFVEPLATPPGTLQRAPETE